MFIPIAPHVFFLFGFFKSQPNCSTQAARALADGALPVGSVPIDRLPRCEQLDAAQRGDGEAGKVEKSIVA